MIGFDPSATVEFSLPDVPGPVFVSRLLSCKQVQDVRALAEKAGKSPDADANDLLNQAILIGVTDWRNVTDEQGQPLPFSPAALDQAFTVLSKFRFVYRYPDCLSLSEVDAKKSALPSPSNGAGSAPTASAESA